MNFLCSCSRTLPYFVVVSIQPYCTMGRDQSPTTFAAHFHPNAAHTCHHSPMHSFSWQSPPSDVFEHQHKHHNPYRELANGQLDIPSNNTEVLYSSRRSSVLPVPFSGYNSSTSPLSEESFVLAYISLSNMSREVFLSKTSIRLVCFLRPSTLHPMQRQGLRV